MCAADCEHGGKPVDSGGAGLLPDILPSGQSPCQYRREQISLYAYAETIFIETVRVKCNKLYTFSETVWN